MKFKKIFVLFLLICLLLPVKNQLFATPRFSVKVDIDKSIKIKQLRINYFNGLEDQDAGNSDGETKFLIKGDLYSLYGSVTIYLEGDSGLGNLNETYFFKEKPGCIKILPSVAKLETFTENVKSISHMGDDKLKQFTSHESADLNSFYTENVTKLSSNDSLLKLAFEKGHILAEKRVKFVTENSDLYLSFWLFHREIMNLTFLSIDSLTSIYKSFPYIFRKTLEGKNLFATLTARRNIKDGKEITISATDIDGHQFTLTKFKGKYLIINFWASWCKPCISEIDFLRAIYSQYHEKGLDILSFSLDTKYLAFDRCIKFYEMNWTHVFDAAKYLRLLGTVAIPQILLISPEGKLLYSSIDKTDPDIIRFKAVFKDNFKQK